MVPIALGEQDGFGAASDVSKRQANAGYQWPLAEDDGSYIDGEVMRKRSSLQRVGVHAQDQSDDLGWTGDVRFDLSSHSRNLKDRPAASVTGARLAAVVVRW
jgi:hypothetical protein